tara:strand:- start:55 stop:615 length:561 start_codon:yes stop_codon:yes gene_type:complete
MEIARMDYRFTAILIILICLLTFFGNPNKAHGRNEYLNNSDRCGEIEARIEKEDRDTTYTYSDSDYDSDNYRFNLSFRKYLGTDCKTSKENMQLKQQLELMKMCNKVNRNPSLAQNQNFALLVSKCRGVVPQIDEIENMPTGSLWDELKQEYIKKNPNSKSLDNNSTLKIPPEGYILPKPKPKIDE